MSSLKSMTVLNQLLKVNQICCACLSVLIGYNGYSAADFVLLKNGRAISRVMVVNGANSGNYYSGSGTIAVQLNVGDILHAQAWRNMNVVSSSCFTVLKIN